VYKQGVIYTITTTAMRRTPPSSCEIANVSRVCYAVDSGDNVPCTVLGIELDMKQKFTECLTKRHRSTAEYMFTW
jgi:hypothetical protein